MRSILTTDLFFSIDLNLTRSDTSAAWFASAGLFTLMLVIITYEILSDQISSALLFLYDSGYPDASIPLAERLLAGLCQTSLQQVKLRLRQVSVFLFPQVRAYGAR